MGRYLELDCDASRSRRKAMTDNAIVAITFLLGICCIGVLGFFMLMIMSEWLNK